MATTLPRQYHFHQTTTILQRHAWPRLYPVNSTFTKLSFSCNIMVTTIPRQCYINLTATSRPRDNATSMPLSRNRHTLQCGSHLLAVNGATKTEIDYILTKQSSTKSTLEVTTEWLSNIKFHFTHTHTYIYI